MWAQTEEQMVLRYRMTLNKPKYVGLACLLCTALGILIGYCFLDGRINESPEDPGLQSRDARFSAPYVHPGGAGEAQSVKFRLLKEQDHLGAEVMEEYVDNNDEDEEDNDEDEDEWTSDGVEVQLSDISTQPDATDFELDEEGRMKRLPNCILIGERKTGTTALLHFLKSHPLIKAADREVHFFDLNRNYRMGFDWYRSQMKPTNSTEITFEKSPRYFRTPWVAPRMRRMGDNIKLLLSVRDPIKRAISDFHFSMESDWYAGFDKDEHTTFEEFVMTDGDEVDGDFAPLQRSLYDKNMENWLKYFKLDNFLILDGDSLSANNPAPALQKIEKFLGLKPYFTRKMFFRDHTKGFYCLKKPGCLYFGGKPHPEVDPKVIEKLRAFFEPHNQKFYEMVGKDFDW